MTLVAACSAKGSPGVTSLACVLGAVWPRPVIVAECDPSGRDLAVRFGLSGRSGISSYLFAARDPSSPPPRLADHCQRLPGGLEVLVGSLGMEASVAMDRELAASRLGSKKGWDVEGQADVVLDCGRIVRAAVGQQHLLVAADVTVLVMRPDIAGIAHARLAVEQLRMDHVRKIRIATLGSGPFRSKDIQSVLDVGPVFEIPEDPAGAAVACGRPGHRRAFDRSPLVVAARRLAATLASSDDQAAGSAAPCPSPDSVVGVQEST